MGSRANDGVPDELPIGVAARGDPAGLAAALLLSALSCVLPGLSG